MPVGPHTRSEGRADASARHAARPLVTISLASTLLLAACGGGADVDAGSSVVVPATHSSILSGTVAVGAPITNGKLRILDAAGAVVVADLAIDADGHYPAVTLTGAAPYRLEACGHAGSNYLCVYSSSNGGGTANVTPLTTAAMLLAAGQAPSELMNGAAAALTPTSFATAQEQLRTSLASILSSAGVSSTIDFVTAPLTAGSRAGYDGVLDAVSVSTGQDAQAFVQITPRLGAGNLYLEQGHSTGTVTAVASAASLQLSGLETLFNNMSAALASAQACASETTGIRRSLAASAQMSMGDQIASGPAAVAHALCGFFGSGEHGNSPIWGSTFLSPTLGRCDVSGPAPVCGVSFVLKSPEGDVEPVGSGMGVTQEGGVWKFMGDLQPIGMHASAKAQRTKRVDTPTPVYEYNRALAFEVAAAPGLACAKVSQRTVVGTPSPIGFYKRHPGAVDQARLSLWSVSAMGNGPSLDPLVGATRSGDDSWIMLPEGAEGDALIRNFYRGGRSVTVSLYSDAACSTPFVIGGKSEYEVDVDGVPPVWSGMEALPWPELDSPTQVALRSLAMASGATDSLQAGWLYAHGPLGVNGVTVCGSRENCGQGGSGRIGEVDLRPSARSAAVALMNNGSALEPGDAKTLAIYGRNGEGVDLQSNFSSCPSVASGESCH